MRVRVYTYQERVVMRYELCSSGELLAIILEAPLQ